MRSFFQRRFKFSIYVCYLADTFGMASDIKSWFTICVLGDAITMDGSAGRPAWSRIPSP
jgi:hypothetical protein